ncbi:MAG: putative selenium-dependent hydroxylase accessory protein YqeC [Planctomycetes bacterium]|nr:putative selenium-dependent hydroxylase accessory protein YqeC [Planctomycetota bacterium]MCC8116068.1 putative selenium-dependent hydroxylase accessory protein YqeC [Planctomycetota bacterium]
MNYDSSLLSAIAIPGIVALVGAGGKTSLLFALADRAAADNVPTMATTTTRMRVPEERAGLAVILSDAPDVPKTVAGTVAYLARPPGPGDQADKVRGVSPETVDAWKAARPDAFILVEADGAAGRLLKAPAAHEPVVPVGTDTVVAVIGLGCFNRPFRDDVVFRPEAVTRLTGLRYGDTMTPEAVLPLIGRADGLFKNSPSGARRILFLNQADLPGAAAVGLKLTSLVRDRLPGAVDAVAVGAVASQGVACRLTWM